MLCLGYSAHVIINHSWHVLYYIFFLNIASKTLDLLQVDSNCIGKKVARRARAPERSEGVRASRLVALAARQILPTRILVGAVLANQIQQLPSMAFPCLFMHICHIVSLYARIARKKLRHS